MPRDALLSLPADNHRSESNLLALTAEGALKGVLHATAVLNFASIAANLAADLTIAVIGAKAGDVVVLAAPQLLDSEITVMAFVSAADIVTIRAANNSAGAVDMAALNFAVLVFRLS